MKRTNSIGFRVLSAIIAFIIAAPVFMIPQNALAYEWHDITLPQLDTPNMFGEKDLNFNSSNTFKVTIKSVHFNVGSNFYNSPYTVGSDKILLPTTAKINGDVIKVAGFESVTKEQAAYYIWAADRSTNENRLKISKGLKDKFGTDFNIVKPGKKDFYSTTQNKEATDLYNHAKGHFYAQTSNQTARTYTNAAGTVTLDLNFDGNTLLRITTNNNPTVNNRLEQRRQQFQEDIRALRDDTRNGIFRSLWAVIAALWNPNSAVLGVSLGIYNNADGSRTRLLRTINVYIRDCNTILQNAGYSRVDNPFPAQ